MIKAGRQASRPLRALKLVVLLAAALAVAWLVLETGAPRAFGSESPLARRLSPNDPDVVFRQAREELVSRRLQLTDETMARVRDAALRAPLEADPFLLEGVRALSRGDIARGERLLVEARARDPRNGLARISLLSVYLQTRRIPLASQEIAATGRVAPSLNQMLVPLLADLVKTPDTADAVAEAIGANPLMDAVLNYLAARHADPNLLQRLAARRRGLQNAGNLQPWQSALIQAAVDRGDISGARDMWRTYGGLAGDARDLVYDARFEGKPGGPPFNWEFAGSRVGSAERSPGSGLSVEFFGRVSGPLASQLIVLPPGRYRLAFQAEGNAKDGRLSWQVQCREAQSPFANIPLQGITYAPKQLAGEFVVPASGCTAQWLRLQGNASEFPDNQSVRITELALTRLGG